MLPSLSGTNESPVREVRAILGMREIPAMYRQKETRGMSRLPKRPKAKHKEDNGKYTQEERDRWLYKTADEMRAINDAVEKRLRRRGIQSQVQPEDSESAVSDDFSNVGKFIPE